MWGFSNSFRHLLFLPLLLLLLLSLRSLIFPSLEISLLSLLLPSLLLLFPPCFSSSLHPNAHCSNQIGSVDQLLIERHKSLKIQPAAAPHFITLKAHCYVAIKGTTPPEVRALLTRCGAGGAAGGAGGGAGGGDATAVVTAVYFIGNKPTGEPVECRMGLK